MRDWKLVGRQRQIAARAQDLDLAHDRRSELTRMSQDHPRFQIPRFSSVGVDRTKDSCVKIKTKVHCGPGLSIFIA